MKSFEEIYIKIFESFHDELESNRKKQNKRIFISWVIIILLFLSVFFIVKTTITLFYLWIFVLVFLSIFMSILNAKHKNQYNKLYKEKVINTLVNSYDSNLKYNPNSSIPADIYRRSELGGCDYYFSNDLIYGKLDGKIMLQLGDVKTEIKTTDSEGHSTYEILFQGLFSQANLNQNIHCTIKILSERKKGKIEKYLLKDSLLQMDSQIFENNFDIITDNKITAMRILTSDILDYMITFKNENKVNFELTLKNQELYIRIHCQNMFESTSIFKDSIEKNALEKYYKYLNFICELNKKFYYTIEEKNI